MSESELPPLPPDVEALLASERTVPDPGEGARLEVFSRLSGTLGLPGATLGGSAIPAAAKGLFGSWVVRGIAIVALGLGGTAVWVGTSHAPSSSTAPRAPAMRAEAPSAAPARVLSPPPSAPRAIIATTPAPQALGHLAPPATSAMHPPTTTTTEREVTDEDLAAERAVLDRARSALSHHDGAAAMSAIREHQRLFARGRLSEEREAMAVQALAVSGQYAAARARGERFHRAFPGSILRRAVDRTLQSIP